MRLTRTTRPRRAAAPAVAAALALSLLAAAAPSAARAAVGTAAAPAETPRNVAVVVYEGMEILDFAGPAEVFAAAGDGFNTYTVGETKDAILSQGFVTVTPEYSIADSPKPDILVIPGGNSGNVSKRPAMMKWVTASARDAEIVMTVCSGAFVLAKAALLDGLEATTWYGAIENLRKAAPKTTVHEHVRFVDNGKFITTAGVSAGIDGALHVIEKLGGRDAAARIATYMEYDKWHPEEGRVVEGPAQKRWTDAAERRRKSEESAAVTAREEGGRQVARVVVDDEGYRPAVVRLRPGVPARLVFERKTESACAAQVQIPELGVAPVELPLGEPTAIDFTPKASGRYRFACGMQMITGTLLVEG